MKSLLSRCAVRRSIGLVIEERRIAISIVSATPLSRRQVFRDVQSCEGESAQEVLERVMGPWIKSRRGRQAEAGPWVQLGVPESQVFQAVVPITQANRNAPPQTYFLEAVQATNIRSEERIIELLKLELNKQPLACVAASPRGAIESLVGMMGGLGTRVGLAEPVPAALYRAGAYHRKPPRGSVLCVRIFLGPHQAIGVLAAGSQPLFWHTFDLTPGEETVAVLAAYSTLWMLWRNCRIPLPIDTMILHGRPEVVLTQRPEAFQQRTGDTVNSLRRAELRCGFGRARSRPGQPPRRRVGARSVANAQALPHAPRDLSLGGACRPRRPARCRLALPERDGGRSRSSAQRGRDPTQSVLLAERLGPEEARC